MSQAAELSILNVGDGDTKLTFDPDKPAERERAKRIVTEMLRRGYTIVVRMEGGDGDPWYTRVQAFDPATCEYVIEGLSKAEEAEIADTLHPKKGRPKKRVPAMSAPAVAIAKPARGCAREAW